MQKAISAKLRSFRESSITTFVGWIPRRPGSALRRILYRIILGRAGRSIQISTGVELINADLIELGSEVKIDRDVRIRNTGRCSKIRIGDRTQIRRGVDIKVHSVEGGCIEIGENVIIGPYSCLSGRSIKIGNFCLIAPHVGIFANNHNFADPHRPIKTQGHSYKGIVIEDDCWLGCGVKVMDGVTIAQGSVIGAGAVVTHNIPPYSIAVGVPAKVVGHRNSSSRSAELDLIVHSLQN
jgi:acetyltransferase-like isoleucine patch superfamily enzyme